MPYDGTNPRGTPLLVLTQKEGEILQVGDDVRIYIKRIKGNWVRLCIDAPRSVELKRIPAPRTREERQEKEEPRFVRLRREG